MDHVPGEEWKLPGTLLAATFGHLWLPVRAVTGPSHLALPVAQLNLAACHIRGGQPEAALPACSAVVDGSDGFAPPAMDRGRALYRRSR